LTEEQIEDRIKQTQLAIQVWHLDSLREVLRVEMNAMPSETPEREAWQYHQTDRSIVQER
jgi:hypothetical protein